VNLARLSQKSVSQFKNLLFVVDSLDFECKMQLRFKGLGKTSQNNLKLMQGLHSKIMRE
jgi:hypothetical protein